MQPRCLGKTCILFFNLTAPSVEQVPRRPLSMRPQVILNLIRVQKETLAQWRGLNASPSIPPAAREKSDLPHGQRKPDPAYA